jgi:hypothetical protein
MMLKMVMIVYNEAIDSETTEALEACCVKNYTKVTAAYGKGDTSGTHLGDDIWPGRNNILYVACEDIKAKQLLSAIRELRKKLGKEGIKGFSWNLEDVT